MAKLKGTHHVITASFTETGSPAYLVADGSWSPNLQEAWAIESDDECALRLDAAHAQQRLVSDPYSIRVEKRQALLEPLSQREAIRATGPSIPLTRFDRRSSTNAS